MIHLLGCKVGVCLRSNESCRACFFPLTSSDIMKTSYSMVQLLPLHVPRISIFKVTSNRFNQHFTWKEIVIHLIILLTRFFFLFCIEFVIKKKNKTTINTYNSYIKAVNLDPSSPADKDLHHDLHRVLIGFN